MTSARNLVPDAFRGITVALMPFVNRPTPGTPSMLGHGPLGESLQPADLVFPWYLLKAHLAKGRPE